MFERYNPSTARREESATITFVPRPSKGSPIMYLSSALYSVARDALVDDGKLGSDEPLLFVSLWFDRRSRTLAVVPTSYAREGVAEGDDESMRRLGAIKINPAHRKGSPGGFCADYEVPEGVAIPLVKTRMKIPLTGGEEEVTLFAGHVSSS